MLDDLMTGKGFPKGRWIELYGDESSGKTTTAVIMAAQAQRDEPDKMIAFVDMEHAFSPQYAAQFGLDLSEDRFLMAQPGSGEEALEIVMDLAGTGLFSVIVFDSVGAIMTKAQLEKGLDEDTMGSVARLLGKSASQINVVSSNTDTTIIWLNQTRNKIVMMGNPETVTGGKTFPFFHSVRIKVRKTDVILGPNKDPIGIEVCYKSIKNKVGIPYREITTTIFFGKGFDEYRELVEVAVKKGVLTPSGAWTYLGKGTPDEMKWNGKVACINWYREHQTEFEQLRDLVINAQNNLAAVVDIAPPADEDAYE